MQYFHSSNPNEPLERLIVHRSKGGRVRLTIRDREGAPSDFYFYSLDAPKIADSIRSSVTPMEFRSPLTPDPITTAERQRDWLAVERDRGIENNRSLLNQALDATARAEAAEKSRNEYVIAYEAAESKLVAVRELHKPESHVCECGDDHGAFCGHCLEGPYPCQTIDALDEPRTAESFRSSTTPMDFRFPLTPDPIRPQEC